MIYFSIRRILMQRSLKTRNGRLLLKMWVPNWPPGPLIAVFVPARPVYFKMFVLNKTAGTKDNDLIMFLSLYHSFFAAAIFMHILFILVAPATLWSDGVITPLPIRHAVSSTNRMMLEHNGSLKILSYQKGYLCFVYSLINGNKLIHLFVLHINHAFISL